MNKIAADFVVPKELIEQVVDKDAKFEKRFASLLKDMNEFIDANGITGKVKVNHYALCYALVDYFEDIRRLKLFHNIEHINNEKIVAYTSYWLLQRKPIQLLDEDMDLLYVNERFVLAYISDFISTEEKKSVLLRQESGMRAFKETLFYFLKYRVANANMIELAIISFFAGRIYQSDDEDISASFDRYSKSEGK